MPFSGKIIMLVDDDPDILTAIKMVLENYHARVDAFNRPDNALEAFKNQPNTYDMVITDVRMPVMNGFELGNKVHTIRAEEPILYFSAFEINREQAGAAPLEDMIQKPIDVTSFCNRVRTRLMNN